MREEVLRDLCDVEECGQWALVILKGHRRSEPLLAQIGEYVCRDHMLTEVERLVNELGDDTDLMGVSILLP